LTWIRIGKLAIGPVVATIVVMALTGLVLVAFNVFAKPDVRSYRAALPFDALGGVLMAGAIFVIVNATLEELVFRGIFFDALESQWGTRITLVVTAVLFGLGHLRGYPPGLLGAGLAAVFGLAMGVLRAWGGGLALPMVAHMGADATIYGILMASKDA
jgi:membrane protease YdiL (CAAX protease family)